MSMQRVRQTPICIIIHLINKLGNKNMKYSEAFEEFVADSMEKMLTDHNAVEKLTMLRTKDESVFDKLREGIMKLVEKVKQEYAKLTPDSAEGRTVATMTDVFSDIQDLFLEAIDDASTNFQKAEKNTIINDGVKMQARSKYARQGGMFSNALTGAEWTKYNHAMTTGMDAGLRISDHSMLVECENGYYSYKLVVYDNTIEEKPIKSIYGIGQNLYNKDITSFDAKIIGEFITELEDIDYDNKKTFERILKHYSRNVGYVLGRYNSKSGRFNRYGREIFENEKSTRQETDRNGVSQRTGKSVKFSNRDSTGRELSAEVAEYFKDSKARDKDGNLLVLYHQTENSFTVFDTHRQGAGSSDNETPYGIFLKSNSKDIGLKGKNQMPLYANITNPFVAEDRQELVYKISQLSVEYLKLHNRRQEIDTEYTEEIKKIDKAREDFIIRWREQNKDADSRILYDSSEFDEWDDAEDSIIEEWTAEVERVSAEGKKVLTEVLKENGYDGIILHNDIGSFGRSTDAYIALESNQVKNIDNINPTSNDDIRFSERGQSVYKLLGENQRLQKENERLKEKVKYLNDFVKLQRKITHGKIIDRRSTEAQARKIKKSTGSKIELSNLTDQLYSFYKQKQNPTSWEIRCKKIKHGQSCYRVPLSVYTIYSQKSTIVAYFNPPKHIYL